MLKTLLVIPPRYETIYPPLGTPALSGYLKSRGMDVKQVDWNIEYSSFAKSEHKDERSSSSYAHLLPDGPLDELPYKDNTHSSFYFTERLLSSPLLFQFINDGQENPFHRFIIEKKLINEIIKWGAGVVGISLISPSQVIFGFTLGYLLKQSNLKIHIVIGGQWVSLYRNQIIKRKDFMEFFDSAVFFEGETPLFRLVKELSDGNDLSQVPNLIYGNGSEFMLSAVSSVERLDELPCPDFEGLPLSRYQAASPEEIQLTFETSRECYWNRCIYCVDLPHPKQGYRAKNPQRVVKDIQHLLNKHPTLKRLIISDPALSPQQMLAISQAIIKENLEVSWWCFARPDKQFTKEVFALAKKAGCATINFGLETANQRLLNLVQKGINIDLAKAVLKNCHEAGIEVRLQIMLGLPTETLEEALETIAFLVENRDRIYTSVFNIYYLTPGCLVYENPGKYDIVPQNDTLLPFQFFIEFSHRANGLSKKEASNLINIYHTLLKDMRDKNSIEKWTVSV